MCAGDPLGDLGQRRITHTSVFKPILRYRDVMSAAVPFANQARARLQVEDWRGSNPTRRPQGLCYRLQLAARRLAEPAVFDFLKFITERKDKEAAADLWRFAVILLTPFETQLLKAEGPDAIELALDRSCIGTGHSYAPGCAGMFGFDWGLAGLPPVTR